MPQASDVAALPPIASPRLRSPPPLPAPPGSGRGQVIHALNPHLRGTAARRSRRMRAARPDIVEKAVAMQTAHDEQVRKRLARDYDDRVTSRFMLDHGGDGGTSPPNTGRLRQQQQPHGQREDQDEDHQQTGGLLANAGGSARRQRPTNILKETETQTLVAGGDSRTAGRQAVSLGSKRLNTLATVVANNPLLQSMNAAGGSSRAGLVTAKAPTRDQSAPIAPSQSTANAGVVKGSVSAQNRPPPHAVATMHDAAALSDPLAVHAVEPTPTKPHTAEPRQ